jgi:aspartokinase
MTGKQQPSHVQKAMGFSDAKAKSSLRFGFSRLNTMDEALAAAEAVKKAVEKLRRVQGGSTGPVVVYSAMGETAHLMSTPANAERIRGGLADYEAGEFQAGELSD